MKERTLKETVLAASKFFSVLLITGPRQIGKTTLLKSIADSSRNYVTLDDFDARALAIKDPALFLQRYSPPVIIDEVQYAPGLFSYIKIAVDREKNPGMFWLTGSQKFHLMKVITESLAGRVAILDLLGFSKAEIEDRATSQKPFLPTESWLSQARLQPSAPKNLMDVYKDIWQGSYPAVVLNSDMPRDLFYKSYVETYIQRDVKGILNISDELSFLRFLRVIAARTGQLLNYSDIARDIDIDHKTAKSWLSVLESSGLIYLLQPYYNNVTKRLIKTPKIYFLDTGLCSYLTQWPSPEALESGAMSGAMLETYLLSEILKSYWHNGKSAYFYYYRDTDQKEVDLLIEEGNALYPVEFKKTATPSEFLSKSFQVLAKLGKNIGHGGVVCFREEDIPLSEEIDVIPIGYL
jgi:predicted AAA+ superfamily ATPase